MEMKRNLLLLIGLCMAVCVQAQKKNFSYKFYGQVRGDLFYNSRANAEIVDGLFHLYPKDVALDADGKDLNASPNGSFYLLYSRLGIDVQGPKVGSAKTSLKLEADFRGSGSNWAVLRIRHAYVNLDWGKSAVLIGQTWHPLFGEVFPQMLNLSTGAPFQPFNRSPQIRYRYTDNGWQLTGSVLWQLQYLSAGPNGKSEEYIKNSCVPEVYLGVDYKKPGWQVGAGMEILTQTCMLGGYGVTSIDPRTGEQEYSPYLFSTSWLNIVYGKKWKPGLFLGYLKNLGANEALVGKTYGVGLDVDQVFTTNLQLSYNLPHWKLGVEYSPSIAWYGNVDLQDGGRIHDTHSITNHRVLGVLIYTF